MQDRKKPETLRLRTVNPALTVNDLDKSVAFYRDVLGFVVHEEITQEGQKFGASMRAGDVDIMLGQDDFAQGRDRVKGVGFRLYCTTAQDVDALAASIKERGGSLATEPTDQSWGTRDFSVEDPDGYKISISTEIPGS